MMTKEEIQQRRAFCGKVAGLSTTGQAIKAIALDTLDALEESRLEIERLKERLAPFICEHSAYHDSPCHLGKETK